jgi:cell division septation protein DedD
LRADGVTLRIQESAVIEVPGATAAYTTNPDVADVITAGSGRLSVTGHTAGTTQLMVITAAGTQSLLITVTAATVASQIRPEAGTPIARYEGRYSSSVARIQNAFDLTTGGGKRRSEFHFLHIRDLHAASNPLFDGIASIYYKHITPEHELTLLDDLVNVSGVTVNNSQVRGIHLTRGRVEAHAGYASPTMYDGLFLPVDRRWVAGAGYGFDVRTTHLTPSVYGFFSGRAGTSARRGVVAALTAEHQDGEKLYLRGDVGVSRSIAASGEFRYTALRSQVRAFLSYKPEDFPTLGLADLSGAHVELDATRSATDRLTLTSRGTYDRLELSGLSQSVGAASFALRYALTTRLAVLGGADGSTVRTATTSIRTIGLPLSAAYEAPQFGVAASYRLLHHSGASRRGDALRLSGHAGAGRFNASVWVDRQRHAPTLELIFRSAPELDLALLRLGITVRNPEDVARALRDNAALVDLGFITGVNFDLTPRRLQAGFNLGWLGAGQRSDHFRLLGIYSRDEGIRTTRESTIATLTYSRRILAATDLYGSFSWWRNRVTTQDESGMSVDLGVRQQFNGFPDFLRRSGTIEGFVFLDPQMRGVRGEGVAPLPNITVTLDGARTARTDSTGAYAFSQVSPGRHRVAAELPAAPRAFFTTPSHAETKVPARIDFGLVWAAARIDGIVVSDAGAGVEGAVLSAVVPSGVPITATSDAAGRFVFALPPGAHRIVLVADSLPAGYAPVGDREKEVRVETDRPQSLTFEVQARRSIGGRAGRSSEVRIESLDRVAIVDAKGNFLFRSMPSGTFTLTTTAGGRVLSQSVTLSAKPMMIDNVDFGVAPDLAMIAAPTARASVVRDRTGFRLQAGAFRLSENAVLARQRIERLGGHAEITRTGALNVVTVGPFVAREAAEAEGDRLRAAGIETIVVGVRDATSSAPVAASSSHVVQTGVFREQRNARQLVGRLQRSGEQPFAVATNGLTVVYVGPFPTRHEAVAASQRLQRAGFDGLVTRR